jgi:hypothetical protein
MYLSTGCFREDLDVKYFEVFAGKGVLHFLLLPYLNKESFLTRVKYA